MNTYIVSHVLTFCGTAHLYNFQCTYIFHRAARFLRETTPVDARPSSNAFQLFSLNTYPSRPGRKENLCLPGVCVRRHKNGLGIPATRHPPPLPNQSKTHHDSNEANMWPSRIPKLDFETDKRYLVCVLQHGAQQPRSSCFVSARIPERITHRLSFIFTHPLEDNKNKVCLSIVILMRNDVGTGGGKSQLPQKEDMAQCLSTTTTFRPLHTLTLAPTLSPSVLPSSNQYT